MWTRIFQVFTLFTDYIFQGRSRTYIHVHVHTCMYMYMYIKHALDDGPDQAHGAGRSRSGAGRSSQWGGEVLAVVLAVERGGP